MAFTYDLGSSNADLLNISKVRFEIGDVVADAGVRPDGSNFTDEEILMLLTDEGDDVMLAAARACDALGRAWSMVAESETVGPLKISQGNVAANWEKRASALRSQWSRSVVYVL